MTTNSKYPDIHPGMKQSECYPRESFRVNGRTFRRTEPGAYTDGKIIAFCDQQDSTAWAARVGDVCTRYYTAPEFAVEKLIAATEALR